MKRALLLTLVGLIGCFAACSSDTQNKSDDSRDAGTSRVAQSQSCQDYLACLVSVAPESVGAAVGNYGPESSCWANAESASLCERACADARVKAGCGNFADGGTADGGSTVDATADTAPPKQGCDKMDVVFVVDDSGSMAGAQAKLRATFAPMVTALNAFNPKSGVPVDYRFAVTSTDTVRSPTMAGQGGFVTMPTSACNPGPSRSWIQRTDADAAAALSCRADLGTAGSATEKPLDALVLSLTDRLADQNLGFLRSDALLAFVILTDEDDSSTNTADLTIGKLDQIKSARKRWAGALISGQKTGACSTPGHNATEAPKLHRLVDATTDASTGKSNVIWRTICDASLDTAVSAAVSKFSEACDAF